MLAACLWLRRARRLAGVLAQTSPDELELRDALTVAIQHACRMAAITPPDDLQDLDNRG